MTDLRIYILECKPHGKKKLNTRLKGKCNKVNFQ